MRYVITLVFLFFFIFGSLNGQDSQDTIDLIGNPKLRIEKILRVESKLTFGQRDSILNVALKLAQKEHLKLEEGKVLMASSILDFSKGKMDEVERKNMKAMKIFSELRDTKGRASALNNLGNCYRENNEFKKADSIFQVVIEIWKDTHDYIKLSKGYNNRSGIYSTLGNQVKADSLYRIALDYARKSKNTSAISAVLNSKLISHAVRMEYDSAISIGLELIKTIDSQKKPLFLAKVMYNMGNLATLTGNYTESVGYFLSADSIFSSLGNINSQASVLSSLANMYEKIGDNNQAKNYYMKSLQYYKATHDSMGMANAFYNLSTLGNTDTIFDQERVSCLDSANKIYRHLGNDKGVQRTNQAYARLYQNLGETEKALEYVDKVIHYNETSANPLPKLSPYYQKGKFLFEAKKYQEAIVFFEKALNSRSGSIKGILDVKYFLSKAYHKVGKNKLAFDNLLFVHEMQDSIKNVENLKVIREIETKYQNEKQDAKIRQQKQELTLAEFQASRQKLMNKSLFIGFLFMATLAGFVFYQRNQKVKINAILLQKNQQISSTNKDLESKTLRIEALNKDIVHRSKNNLTLLASVLQMQERRTGSSVAKEVLKENYNRIMTIASLDKQLLERNNDSTVDLRSYLMKIIYNAQNLFASKDTSVDIVSNISEGIVVPSSSALSLGIIINELITNSAKHAFSSSDKPLINIDLTKDDKGNIILDYQDNGSGFSEEIDLSSANSMGLKLIRIMSDQLYGEYHWENELGARFVLHLSKDKIA